MPGPRSICPAPAGSGSIRPPASCRRRPHPARLLRPTASAPRRSPAACEQCRGRIRLRDGGDGAFAKTPRVTKPYTEEQWAAIVDAGRPGRREPEGGDVRLTMGGEPTFVADRRHGRRRVEHRRAGPDQARSSRQPASAGCAGASPRAAAALRPGQMVSGRAAAALGARLLLAQGRRAVWADDQMLIADDAEPDYAHRRAMPATSSDALAEALGCDRQLPCRPTRTSALPAAQEQAAAGQCRSARAQAGRSAETRARLRGSSSADWASRSATSCRCSRWHPGAGPPLDDRTAGTSAQTPVPAARRFADGAAPAAGVLPWVCSREDFPHVYPADPFAARGPLPIPKRGCSAGRPPGGARSRRGAPSRQRHRPTPLPRCRPNRAAWRRPHRALASSRATARCMSSCRR